MLNDGRYEVLGRLEPMSFCKFVAGKKKAPLLKVIWKMVQRYGNLPNSCPIKKGQYFVNDFELDDGIIPSLAPSGSYKVDIVVGVVSDVGVNKVIQKIVTYATLEQGVDDESESQGDDMQE